MALEALSHCQMHLKNVCVSQHQERKDCSCVLGKSSLANLPPQKKTQDAMNHGIVLTG